jgi:hypothetical protein
MVPMPTAIVEKITMTLIKTILPWALVGSVLVSTFTFAQPVTETSTAARAEILRPLLNSERIKTLFGNYAITVLKANQTLRISNLYSSKEGIETTRTLAIVAYPETIAPAYAKEHQQIVAGGSIGSTLKQAGWSITKRPLYFGELKASSDLQKLYRQFMINKPTDITLHMYDLYISKGEQSYLYSTIYELHHPEYLTFKDLQAIYPTDSKTHAALNSELEKRIVFIKKSIEELPLSF